MLRLEADPAEVIDDDGGKRLARDDHSDQGRGPEPVVPAVLWELCERAEIVTDYHNARHGVPREEVKPLTLSLAEIERWEAKLMSEEAAA